MLNDGDQAPSFALTADDGATIDLASLRGRCAVLYFYPKDDTSGCTAEARDFNRLGAEFEEAGVAVVGVSPDGVESHKKFKAKHGLNLRLASDTAKSAAEAFGVWVEKSMYGKTYMGVERSTFLIDGAGKIVKSWRKVKVPGHAEAVLAAAREARGRAR